MEKIIMMSSGNTVWCIAAFHRKNVKILLLLGTHSSHCVCCNFYMHPIANCDHSFLGITLSFTVIHWAEPLYSSPLQMRFSHYSRILHVLGKSELFIAILLHCRGEKSRSIYRTHSRAPSDACASAGLIFNRRCLEEGILQNSFNNQKSPFFHIF